MGRIADIEQKYNSANAPTDAEQKTIKVLRAAVDATISHLGDGAEIVHLRQMDRTTLVGQTITIDANGAASSIIRAKVRDLTIDVTIKAVCVSESRWAIYVKNEVLHSAYVGPDGSIDSLDAEYIAKQIGNRIEIDVMAHARRSS